MYLVSAVMAILVPCAALTIYSDPMIDCETRLVPLSTCGQSTLNIAIQVKSDILSYLIYCLQITVLPVLTEVERCAYYKWHHFLLFGWEMQKSTEAGWHKLASMCEWLLLLHFCLDFLEMISHDTNYKKFKNENSIERLIYINCIQNIIKITLPKLIPSD